MWTAAESLPAPEGGSKESPARMCGRITPPAGQLCTQGIRKIYIHKSNSRPLNGLLAALTCVSSELHYLMLKSRCRASQEVI